MKKSLLLLSLLVFNIAICFFGLKRNFDHQKQLESLINYSNTEKSEISRALLLSYKYQDSSIIISEEMKEKLNSLCGNNPTLILRFNFPFCENCVYPVIDSIENIYLNSDKQVLILTSFPNEDYASEFNTYMMNKPFIKFNIPNNEFVFDDSGEMGTFLLIMFPDFSFKKLYMPNKYNHFLLKQYLPLFFKETI